MSTWRRRSEPGGSGEPSDGHREAGQQRTRGYHRCVPPYGRASATKAAVSPSTTLPVTATAPSRPRATVTLIIYIPTNYKLLRGPVEPRQFASWVFSNKVTEAGLAPSVGAVGAPFDNAMVEAFWARMQVELLNRKGGRLASSSPLRSTTTSRSGTTPNGATAP